MIKKDIKDEIELINELSTLLAEIYQLLGAIALNEEEYRPQPSKVYLYMDYIIEVLSKTDKFFNDDLYNRYSNKLDKKLKKKNIANLKKNKNKLPVVWGIFDNEGYLVAIEENDKSQKPLIFETKKQAEHSGYYSNNNIIRKLTKEELKLFE